MKPDRVPSSFEGIAKPSDEVPVQTVWRTADDAVPNSVIPKELSIEPSQKLS